MRSLGLKIQGLHGQGCAQTLQYLWTRPLGAREAKVSFVAPPPVGDQEKANGR